MEFHEHISSQFIFHGIQVLSAVSSILYLLINYTVNHHLVMGTLFSMLISLSAPSTLRSLSHGHMLFFPFTYLDIEFY